MRVLSLILVICALSASAMAEGIKTVSNVAYGAHAAQRYDVYTSETHTNAPILIMLHGGAWRIGSKTSDRVWKAKAAHFVPEGYVFVSVETRLLGDGADPRMQAEDLARAIRHVRDTANRWGGDRARVVALGHSSGGHVAALVAADAQLRAISGDLAGVVVLDSGGLDLEGVMQRDPPRAYQRAFGKSRAFWTSASPMAQMRRGAPPFLVLCRARSTTVCPDAERFAEAAGRVGVSVEVVPVHKSHRAINADLGRPGRYTERIADWIARAVR
ncbi:MAG: alpha/beta hydrolase [Paracoccaceae bacterium]